MPQNAIAQITTLIVLSQALAFMSSILELNMKKKASAMVQTVVHIIELTGQAMQN